MRRTLTPPPLVRSGDSSSSLHSTGTTPIIDYVEDAPRTAKPVTPVNGTLRLTSILDVAAAVWYAPPSPSPTHVEVRGKDDLRNAIASQKRNAAVELAAMGDCIQVLGRGSRNLQDKLSTLAENLMDETDTPEGNAELMRVLIKHVVAVDFLAMVVQQGWALKAAQDGCPQYLEIFLSYKRVGDLIKVPEAEQLIHTCASHATKRVALLYSLLKCYKNIPVLASGRDALALEWQQAFEAVCEERGSSIAGKSRMDVMLPMLSLPNLMTIDVCNTEGKDGQTVFSRACQKGDAPLVKTLLTKKLVTDINRVQSDGTTALLQAVLGNHKHIISMLLRETELHTNAGPPVKRAVALAQERRAPPEVIELLRCLDESGSAGLYRAVTPPPKLSRDNRESPPSQILSDARAPSRSRSLRKKLVEFVDSSQQRDESTNPSFISPNEYGDETFSRSFPVLPVVEGGGAIGAGDDGLNIVEVASEGGSSSSDEEAATSPSVVVEPQGPLKGHASIVAQFHPPSNLAGTNPRRGSFALIRRNSSRAKCVSVPNSRATSPAVASLRREVSLCRATSSVRSLLRSNSGTHLTGDAPPDKKTAEGKDATKAFIRLLTPFEIFLRKRQLERRRSRKSVRDLSQDAEGEMLDREYRAIKTAIADELPRLGDRLTISGTSSEDLCKLLIKLAQNMMDEPETRDNNPQLLQVLIERVAAVDFCELIMQHGWVLSAAEHGYAHYLDTLLQCDGVGACLGVPALKAILSACASHANRVALLASMLRHHKSIPAIASSRAEFQAQWQQSFEIVAANPIDHSLDPHGAKSRMELLISMLSLPSLMVIDTCNREGDDCQTVFSRACQLGDVPLVRTLLALFDKHHQMAVINRVQRDETTALIQAVRCDREEVVRLLLSQDVLVTNHCAAGLGTAHDIAMAKDSRFVDALKDRFEQEELNSEDPDYAIMLRNLKYRQNRRRWRIGTVGKEFSSLIKQLSSVGAAIRALQQQVEADTSNFETKRKALKASLVQALKSGGEHVELLLPQRNELCELLHGIVTMESDQCAGNPELIACVFARVSNVEWSSVVTSRRWMFYAATTASVHFLQPMLTLIELDRVLTAPDVRDLLRTCAKHAVSRVPLLQCVVGNAKLVPNSAWQDEEVQEELQDAFKAIVFDARPHEDRNGRLDLLRRMLSLPYFHIDPAEEGAGKQTIMSRAAQDGDCELLRVLVENMGPLCVDAALERVQSDGTTALLQAVSGGHLAAVEYLVSLDKDINIAHCGPRGCAMDVARDVSEAISLCLLKAHRHAVPVEFPHPELPLPAWNPTATNDGRQRTEESSVSVTLGPKRVSVTVCHIDSPLALPKKS